jgi:hypothetical protein
VTFKISFYREKKLFFRKELNTKWVSITTDVIRKNKNMKMQELQHSIAKIANKINLLLKFEIHFMILDAIMILTYITTSSLFWMQSI